MIHLAGLTWSPFAARRRVLDGVDLDLAEGERVLLAGPSGAGKSTLLRALAGLLDDSGGDLSGTVLLDGQPPERSPGAVGLVPQDPAASAVSVSVGRDLAFGPENLGLAPDIVADRVRAALTGSAFPYGPDRRTSALSGGERQRLALAGLLALAPRLLLLDEPLAMLDPVAAAALHDAVMAAVADRRTGLVVVDHHLDRWWADVDRLVVLGSGGAVVAAGTPAAVLADHGPELAAAGLWLPGAPVPPRRPVPASRAPSTGGAPVLAGEDVGVLAPNPLVRNPLVQGAGREARAWAVRGAGAALDAGSVSAVTGASGAGKSTLLAALGGLTAPTAGRVCAAPGLADGLDPAPHRWRSRQLASRISWTPQNPADGFLRATAAAEIDATPQALGRPLTADRIEHLLEAAGLADRGSADPRRLSGGEQRRLAIVAALAAQAPVLLLDEPTVGQDRSTWSSVVDLLRQAADTGVAVGLATHDRLLVDVLADGVTVLTRPVSDPVAG